MPFLFLADIVDSSLLPKRELTSIMNRLEKCVQGWNKEYKMEMVVPMNISYGDEIAALLKTPRPIFKIVQETRSLLFPHTRIRFVVVKGNVGADNPDIRKVGGPAFKRADELLSIAKKKDWFACWETGSKITDTILNSLCGLTDTMLNDMSTNQREIYQWYSQGFTQKEIAIKMGKYPQYIWTAMNKSHISQIHDAEKAIHQILEVFV